MAEPTIRQVHVNQPLTQISIAYIQDTDMFIATDVFPNIPVQKQSDRYYKYLKKDWYRDVARKRAPATESAGGGYNLDNTPTYFCERYSIHKDVADEIRANADDVINMDRDATEWVTQMMLLRREKQWANNFFTNGVWGTELDGVPGVPNAGEFKQWDQADSTPIEDIREQSVAVAELTGFRPNTLVLSPHVYTALSNHADILDRIKYTQQGVVTTDILAGLFDVERVLIAWGTENIAADSADADMNFVFGKHALLAYANPAPSILQPSAGYTFSWQGLLGAGAAGTRIRQFRMEELNADRIEGDLAMDMKVIAEDLGVFFENAVS